MAFAGNSLLCRMALLPDDQGVSAIDASMFTSLRLLSGALVLVPLLFVRRGPGGPSIGSAWPAALALAIYGITFSLSYVTVPAGIGALILFGTVQILMLGVALLRGERLQALQVLGFISAIAGILVLTLPSGSIPGGGVDLVGALLMVVAGVGWGSYTLLGRGAKDPVLMTARNFACCLPFAVALGAFALLRPEGAATTRGVLLSITAGAVTSGAGYALWYTALRGHTRTSAAAVQLLVPILAAVGGFLLLDEALTLRLALASVLVLGGVGAAIAAPRPD